MSRFDEDWQVPQTARRTIDSRASEVLRALPKRRHWGTKDMPGADECMRCASKRVESLGLLHLPV